MWKEHFTSFNRWAFLQRWPANRFPTAEETFHRHSLIKGWDQQKVCALQVLSVGAGALGGWFSRAMVRMGPARLDIMDFDRVEASNLPRQPFDINDIGKPKAIQLRDHLLKERTNSQTQIEAYLYSLEQAVQQGLPMKYDLAYVGVDSDPTRAFAARLFQQRCIPTIFAGTGKDSQKGYSPDAPCLACMNPSIVTTGIKAGCSGAAADVPVVLAGMAIYALEALIMDRTIDWDYWEIALLTGKSIATRVIKKDNCPICSHRAKD
jgi:molybdopterin/thiamine biosynthesis adenylyltransferase